MANTLILENISEAVTLQEAARTGGRRATIDSLTRISNPVIVIKSGKIVWIGPKKLFSQSGVSRSKAKRESLDGRVVVPGFVECHTHSCFVGSRAQEFEMKLQGKSYLEIAQSGGGIQSTVRAVRAATDSQLFEQTKTHIQRFLNQGVTTLEIKSGYGLNEKEELRILKILQKVKGPRVVTTYLGPHSRSPELSDNNLYIHQICKSTLAKVKKLKLSRRADIFVDQGFFSIDDFRAYTWRAKSLGFDICVHAEQLSRQGIVSDAIQMNARSLDHLIHINDDDIHALAKSEITGVLLPAADEYLGISFPPARRLIDAGARVALATDFNPGTSPTQDLSYVGFLARTKMKMSLPEVLTAYTVGGAYALGLETEIGSLDVGKSADLCSLSGPWENLFFQVGHAPVHQVWRSGKILKKT